MKHNENDHVGKRKGRTLCSQNTIIEIDYKAQMNLCKNEGYCGLGLVVPLNECEQRLGEEFSHKTQVGAAILQAQN